MRMHSFAFIVIVLSFCATGCRSTCGTRSVAPSAPVAPPVYITPQPAYVPPTANFHSGTAEPRFN
jgi:hypothetical protein